MRATPRATWSSTIARFRSGCSRTSKIGRSCSRAFPTASTARCFYQKDAPAFAPPWIRTEKIYSEDSQREISYFILDSEEALAYVANLAAITIHMWSSRIQHLERPDWLLFDIDPKGSTTRQRSRSCARGS